ncbi:MAG: phosphatidylserine decarboxylase [Gammaproteobacteria bacterium]|nr:phosphatidylserine decarboxylase [Gammaproteobacteria bacterium]
MANVRYPLLAREGWVHVVVVLTAAWVVTHFFGWLAAIPAWLIAILVVQFFRDPPRRLPNVVGAVICPADGLVIAVGEGEDPYLKRPAKRLCIFMSPFNVHSNRMPLAGQVKDAWYHPGQFVNAALEKASHANERNAVWLRTDEGHDVVVVQVAGFVARRILCYIKPGDRVELGQRYGFIRFGSRVEVYLPLNVDFRVSLGDKVTGGSDIIAHFKQ